MCIDQGGTAFFSRWDLATTYLPFKVSDFAFFSKGGKKPKHQNTWKFSNYILFSSDFFVNFSIKN